MCLQSYFTVMSMYIEKNLVANPNVKENENVEILTNYNSSAKRDLQCLCAII